jgi:hypothetical protein
MSERCLSHSSQNASFSQTQVEQSGIDFLASVGIGFKFYGKMSVFGQDLDKKVVPINRFFENYLFLQYLRWLSLFAFHLQYLFSDEKRFGVRIKTILNGRDHNT